MLNGIRIRFVRGEEVKFISHLDLMKAFERALRRSRLPIAYSQGFNPHPLMVFGLPLSVGVTSEAEYADFGLSTYLDPVEFSERLNEELPSGLKIIGAKSRLTGANIMASVVMASYEALVCRNPNVGINILQEKIREFLLKPSIKVKKEGKSGVRDVDIRPMIHKLDVCAIQEAPVFESLFCLSMLLCAGSACNLKPELLITALNEAADLKIETLKIHRTGLFTGAGGKLADPLETIALSV